VVHLEKCWFETGTTGNKVPQKNQHLSKLAVSNKDTDIFACIQGDNTVVLNSQKTIQSISQIHSNVKLNDIAFSYDSSYLYGAGKGEIYVWDIRSSICYARYKDYGNINTPILVNCPNGIYQATGSDMGVVNLYQIEDNFKKTTTPQPLKDFYNLTTAIKVLAFNHDSQLLAFASSAKPHAVRLLNTKSRTVYKDFPGITLNRHIINTLAFSPHSENLLIGTNKGFKSYQLSHFKHK